MSGDPRSTPTRRGLLAGAAALPAAGALAAVPGLAGGPVMAPARPADDAAEIAALCRQFERLGRRSADADLLAAYTRFLAAHVAVQDCDLGRLHPVTDEAVNTRLDLWYEELEHIATRPAMTAEGRRAKVMAAYLAMSTVVRPEYEVSWESRLAHSALADLVGSAAA